MRTGTQVCLLAGGLGAALTLLAPSVLAGTARRDPPLLFGAGPHQVRSPVVIDPALPTGTRLAAQLERPHSAGAACSARMPVCVQRGSAVSGADALNALSALELAYQRVVQALGLPAPLPDDGHGGSDALDWYLDGEHSELVTERDALGLGGFDRAAAFCVSAGSSDAALLERDATLCLGEAIAKRFAPGEPASIQRAFATELWWLTGRITALDVQAIDDAQQHPERALAARNAESSTAASLLFDFLERARSSQRSGWLVTSLLSAAASTTPSGAYEWNDEPDVFDVLRHSLDEDTQKTATLFGQYAVSRAFLGDRDDGAHPPFEAWAGAFGRANYDWVIRFSSLPRRVRASRPIEPTGIELIWVDLDEVPIGVSLGFESEWEAPVAFRWTLVSVDDHGQEMARVDVPFQERGRSSEGRIVNLMGVRAVLAIGINMGGVDLGHPFDPDLDPFESQSCTAYFARM
ncbi:MAG TPA: hypothetical protein VHW01_19795 [Polyangiaceae bacterium]|jgi:hypothetical protein|nr:hypothetical protein [Polyangiaceae bacterium]